MTTAFGLALMGLSIALIKLTRRNALAGHRYWAAAADSAWLPILFTATFGLGFVAILSGVLQLLGS